MSLSAAFYYARQHASYVLAIVEVSVRPSVCLFVCPSVRHSAVLYQNGASKDHAIFTVGCPQKL